MKSSFKYLLAMAFLGGSAAAHAQSDWFVGGALTSGKLKGDYEETFLGTTYKESISETDSGLQLRTGLHLNQGRVYGSLNHTSYDGLDLLSVTGSYDFIHSVNESVALYAGGTVGFGQFDFDDFDTENSYILGIQLGAIFQVTEQLSIDIGAFYQKVDAEYKESEVFMGQTLAAKATIDSLSGFRAGIDYSF